ncbi:MAG TPA: hypothetical protein VGA69_12215 [Nitriliruptorales bacterium]
MTVTDSEPAEVFPQIVGVPVDHPWNGEPYGAGDRWDARAASR